jgi:excinuclease UvrABC nuclease subunit
MNLSDLKQQLEIAVSEESFGEAARLRDRIQEISHDMKAAVDYANTRFYEAFKNADNDAMSAIWGDGESVQCIHPGMAALVGVTP